MFGLIRAAFQRVLALVFKPGLERWAVKTGTDADARSVVLTPVPVTIAALISIAPPNNPTSRTGTVEHTVYSIGCTLARAHAEADGDYHCVLQDQNGRTMIAEIPNPDPKFVNPSSPWCSQIAAARNSYVSMFGLLTVAPPNQAPMIVHLGKPVTITGVGFFDKLHGQDGVAGNGVELHPVLSLIAG
jgi:hypothetical protein